MISTDSYAVCKTHQSALNLYELMLVPLKMHSTGLTYLEGRIISKVKSGIQSFLLS